MVLIHQGLVSSSQATYASVWQSYERFAALRRFSPYPVSEHALINFLNWKFVMGSAGNSLKLYTQALPHKHVLRGLDLTPFASARVKLLYQGACRSPPKSLRVRDAATPEDLCSVLRYLQVSTTIQRDRAMLWGALTLAFHGLLRVSEYTATETKHSLDYRHVILHRSSIEVHLAHTKTAQYGTGQDISVRLTGTATCPHAALVTYLKARGKQPGALFTFNDGTPLKPRDVNVLLQAALPNKSVRSHSLRIGAATLAGKNGIPDYVLKAAGRWQSSAYLRYVRTPIPDKALPASVF